MGRFRGDKEDVLIEENLLIYQSLRTLLENVNR
jgi:hypothetical protein